MLQDFSVKFCKVPIMGHKPPRETSLPATAPGPLKRRKLLEAKLIIESTTLFVLSISRYRFLKNPRKILRHQHRHASCWRRVLDELP